MTDLLIKGMEMPENCEKCPFLDYEQGFCFASGEKRKSGWYVSTLYSGSPEFNTMRNPKCPLIEVPTPHGRLIDVDTILNDRGYATTFGSSCGDKYYHETVLLYAPTVIEAEE